MSFNLPEREENILAYWKENDIFRRTVEKNKKKRKFVFFEGPPTANGKPGIHHFLARIYKDIICRYKTMQGFEVQRKGGWDTHGLPVEIEVEKKLGLTDKKQIEDYGIAKFNKMCRESVWEYKKIWEDFTQRIGYWIDLENPYITYQTEYIETVWWILKELYDQDLLYEGYRVAPYCPRCGTSLSSHELAQGYKIVKDPSFFIKIRLKKAVGENNENSLLVWTTTPWTLPGNVAVAVNPKVKYVLIKTSLGEKFWLAKNRLCLADGQYEIQQEISGSELTGWEYEPLYPAKGDYRDIYKIIAADFVSDQDGTGFVHIAPAFGEDDMNAVKLLSDKGLSVFPILRTVDENGKMIAPGYAWNGLFVKRADFLIKDDLQGRNLLYKEEFCEHEYPFCWRCKSPLIYYAQNSWFVRMSSARKELSKNNEQINWIPEHIKNGRFGLWLKEAKDWNLSRNRFWGTSLPVWKCGNNHCGHTAVCGSMKDILEKKHTSNNFYVMRHGISECLQQHINVCQPDLIGCPLTKEGKKGVAASAQTLAKKTKIDLIYSSDLMRAKQTAEIAAEILGLSKDKIIFHHGLRERDCGEFNHRAIKEAGGWMSKQEHPGKTKFPGGESLQGVMSRIYSTVKEINRENQNKNILIISHESLISTLEHAVSGKDFEKMYAWYEKFWKEQKVKKSKDARIKPAEWRSLDFKNLPFNEEMDFDLHRPYVDEVEFICEKCRNKMKRVAEVIDCWFDSGAMPFAQWHYPFENKILIEKNEQFPADYISEAIDQTRGWFYTLLAISTLLGTGAPYKNVICLGHILDEKGEKMSKSKGNIIDPWNIMKKYGADAVRWHFYTVNQPGDPKLFSEKDPDQATKRFIMILWNCLVFYKTYAKAKIISAPPRSKNILDRWFLSRLNSLVAEVNVCLDNYNVSEAARNIEKFVNDDLSLWYIRRSRKRFQQPNNKKDFADGSRTLGYGLYILARLCAPFVPFFSEEIYQQLGGKKKDSVHLQAWPKTDKKKQNPALENQMRRVRELITLALAQRAKSAIKVRQPLSELKIPLNNIVRNKELAALIAEEVNVKKVLFGHGIFLNTEITPDLREEGIIRDIIRNVMDARKEMGLQPKDRISVSFDGDKEILGIIKKKGIGFLQDSKIARLEFVENLNSGTSLKGAKIDGKDIVFCIKRIK